MNRHSRRQASKRSRSSVTFEIDALEPRKLLSSAAEIFIHPNLTLDPQASGSTVSGYTPQQIAKAYGFDQISFGGTKGDGAGQTIAIVDAYDNPNIESDLKKFSAQFDLANPPSFKKVSQTGGSTGSIAADAGWAYEISLDVEWAHAIAPAANLLLVEAKSNSLSDLLTAVNFARNAPGVSAISLSWGAGEFSSETSFDKYFATPSGHQGVTFVAASGDQGTFWGPEWPATSPQVVSVGGTSLNLADNSGAYGAESPWRYSTGGVSWYESEPGYQSTVQTTGRRSSPDVSYNANPYTGFAVYNSYSDPGSGGWSVVGGTSAGAPQWAALIAIANQGRALSGMGTLDGAGTLSGLYAMYSSATTYTDGFNDIVGTRSRFGGGARAGYDTTTGLGTPHAVEVVRALTEVVTVSVNQVTVRTSRAVRAARPSIVTEPRAPLPAAAAASDQHASTASRVVSALSLVSDHATASANGSEKPGLAITAPGVDSATNLLAAAPASTRLIYSSRWTDHPDALAPAVHAAQPAAPSATPEKASPEQASLFLSDVHSVHIAPLGSPFQFLADSLAAFADQSAAIPNLITHPNSEAAWAITSVVIAADIVLFTYAYHRNTRARRQAAAALAAHRAARADWLHHPRW